MKKLHYAIIFVSDMARSVAFYRETLGLALKMESPHWTEFATEGTTLAPHPADSVSPEGTERGRSPAGSCHPGFEVPDLDAFHNKMQAAGVRCLQAPKVEDFGGKLALYADPDGLPITVAEAPKK